MNNSQNNPVQEDTKTQKLLKQTFGNLASQAVEYKREIDNAKTQLKKDYYSKKLKKINKDALAVLRLIEASNREELKEQTDEAEGE